MLADPFLLRITVSHLIRLMVKYTNARVQLVSIHACVLKNELFTTVSTILSARLLRSSFSEQLGSRQCRGGFKKWAQWTRMYVSLKTIFFCRSPTVSRVFSCPELCRFHYRSGCGITHATQSSSREPTGVPPGFSVD